MKLHEFASNDCLPLRFLQSDFSTYTKNNPDSIVKAYSFYNHQADITSPYAIVLYGKGEIHIKKFFGKYTPDDLQEQFSDLLFDELTTNYYINCQDQPLKDLVYKITLREAQLENMPPPFLRKVSIKSVEENLIYVIFSKQQYLKGRSDWFHKYAIERSKKRNRIITILSPEEEIPERYRPYDQPSEHYKTNSLVYPKLSMEYLHNNTGSSTYTFIMSNEKDEVICWVSHIINNGFVNLRGSGPPGRFSNRDFWKLLGYSIDKMLTDFPSYKITFAVQPGHVAFRNVVAKHIAPNYPNVALFEKTYDILPALRNK